MDAKSFLFVAIGGALGAVARYAVSEWSAGDFPWGTTTVNLVGSLLLGLLMGASLVTGKISPEMMLLLATGLLGAFTTMSTFSVELVQQIESGLHSQAAAYVAANMVGCPLLAYGGWRVAALLLG